MDWNGGCYLPETEEEADERYKHVLADRDAIPWLKKASEKFEKPLFSDSNNIIVVGESGEPIHFIEVSQPEGMLCDEALLVTCTGMQNMVGLCASSMALKEFNGEIIPFAELIEPGSIVQLISVKGNQTLLQQRIPPIKGKEIPKKEISTKELTEELNKPKPSIPKETPKKESEEVFTMRATYDKEMVDRKYKLAQYGNLYKLLVPFCKAFKIKYSKHKFIPLNEEAEKVLALLRPIDGAEFEITKL